ncbi:MAG: thiamine diphosphokinase [Lachnospiraceae bacterium]|nr:thiamine diphosphokinase [Lachnospiraceae bacterium]
MSTCIIIGAGNFSEIEIPVGKDDYVIAADGGYQYCKRMQIVPDFVLGDMDSIAGEMRQEIDAFQAEHPDKVKILPCMKDDTDMMSAIRMGLSKGYKKFVLYGAMGGRLEHTIANIQCLIYLKNQGAHGCMIEKECTVMVVQNETIHFQKEKEGFFSMFALQQRAEGVTIRGMKYPLEDAVVTDDFPIGISNEFIGEASEITVKKGTLLLILSIK